MTKHTAGPRFTGAIVTLSLVAFLSVVGSAMARIDRVGQDSARSANPPSPQASSIPAAQATATGAQEGVAPGETRLIGPFLLVSGGSLAADAAGPIVVWSAPVGGGVPAGGDMEVFLFDADSGIELQITDNDLDDLNPRTDGRRVTWVARTRRDQNGMESNRDVYVYDIANRETTRITDTDADEISSEIDGDHVVWREWNRADGSGSAVFLHDLRTGVTTQLSDSSGYSGHLAVEGDFVVWDRLGPEGEILFHRISSGVTQTIPAPSEPLLSEGRVVWHGAGDDIYLYDSRSEAITKLSNNAIPENAISFEGNLAVWMARIGDQYDVLGYDLAASRPLRLTDSPGDDTGPRVSAGQAVWHSSEGGVGGSLVACDLGSGKTVVLKQAAAAAWDLMLSQGMATWEVHERHEPNPFPGSIPWYDVYLAVSRLPWAPSEEPATERSLFPIFTDVPPEHPQFAVIQGLAVAGVVSGQNLADLTSVFKPDGFLARAQIAKMLVLAARFPLLWSKTPAFSDLGPNSPGSNYPHEYVWTAYDRGVVQGITRTRFGPWQNVSRVQLVTMTVRAARAALPSRLATPPSGFSGTLGDFSPIHAENMRVAEYNGLLEEVPAFGPGWDPWQPATRAEAAQVVWNLVRMGTP